MWSLKELLTSMKEVVRTEVRGWLVVLKDAAMWTVRSFLSGVLLKLGL